MSFGSPSDHFDRTKERGCFWHEPPHSTQGEARDAESEADVSPASGVRCHRKDDPADDRRPGTQYLQIGGNDDEPAHV